MRILPGRDGNDVGSGLAAMVVVTIILVAAEGQATASPTALTSGTTSAAELGEDWPGPNGPWVFIEGPAFDVQGAGWALFDQSDEAAQQELRRKRKLWPRRLGPYLSQNRAVMGTESGDGHLKKQVDVPEAGEYRLWLRHSKWPGQVPADRVAPFRVRIEQEGEVRYEGVFADGDDGPPPAHQPIWNADMLWSSADVSLEAGPATVKVFKVGPDEVRATLRMIDCVLLTTDHEYEPDYRDFGPQSFARFTLHDAEPGHAYLYALVNHMHPPVWVENFRFARDGVRRSSLATRAQQLEPGESTPWMNVSRMLYHHADSIVRFQATHAVPRSRSTSASYALSFASAPTDDAVVTTVQRSGEGPGMRVRVGPWIDADNIPRADYEYTGELLRMTERLPSVDFGRRPTQFPVYTEMVNRDGTYSPAALRDEKGLAQYMGLNGKVGTVTQADIDAGLRFAATSAHIWYFDGHISSFNPDVERMESAIRSAAERLMDGFHADGRVLHVKLMDEVSALPMRRLMQSELDQRKFREWLVDEGYYTQAQIEADPGAFTLTRDRDDSRLYYLSHRFRAWSVLNFFFPPTEMVRRHFPEGTGSTQTFSDRTLYYGSMFGDAIDYWLWFRKQALDVAQPEDWGNHALTDQIAGWTVGLFRSATRYHGQPIHAYVIASGNRAPLVVKLKAYAAIAQGADALQIYAFSPRYGWHEGGWGHRPEIYAALAELSREIGAAEHILLDAMPTQADTAIIYSLPQDVWHIGFRQDTMHANERVLTYLALRHAHVPVDVLPDRDLPEGALDDYRVAYLAGLQVEQAALEALVDWVKAGGTLVLSPGAGSRNEFNEPTDALDRGLGIARDEVEHLQRVAHTTMHASRIARPQRHVQLADGGVIDRLAWAQTFPEPAPVENEAEVMARDDAGAPAAVRVNVGKGQVVAMGFMPAQAYGRSAWLAYEPKRDEAVRPLRIVAGALAAEGRGEASTMTVPRREHAPFPTDFDEALREFIAYPARLAEVAQPVTADHPLVEVTWLSGEHGWAVPVANWSGETRPRVTLTIRPDRPVDRVVSARHGPLKVRNLSDNAIEVELSLESTDLVFAEWIHE